jgi:uncharacterized membrane-anchored protein
MWLLVTGLAAVIVTALWYVSLPSDTYKLGFLSLIYWGATLMWLVDHAMAYINDGGPFLEVSADAAALAFSVLALGLFVWLVRLVLSDPRRMVRALLRK